MHGGAEAFQNWVVRRFRSHLNSIAYFGERLHRLESFEFLHGRRNRAGEAGRCKRTPGYSQSAPPTGLRLGCVARPPFRDRALSRPATLALDGPAPSQAPPFARSPARVSRARRSSTAL